LPTDLPAVSSEVFLAKEKIVSHPLDDLQEQELIQRVHAGDREAWDFIARQYYTPLLNFVTGMVRVREQAEELVQDVFVNFWVKRDRLNVSVSLKAYLYRAARNHTLNFIKRRNFEANYHSYLAKTTSAEHNETEDAYHFSELEKALYGAIDEMPEKRREIFTLSRFEDMTYKEIAETLDIPVRTVHYQIGLALKELREKLSGIADERFLRP
jgi:RNA polymerase sigma-70 factor (ECF subfamily)